jgi:hypothetical protein
VAPNMNFSQSELLCPVTDSTQYSQLSTYAVLGFSRCSAWEKAVCVYETLVAIARCLILETVYIPEGPQLWHNLFKLFVSFMEKDAVDLFVAYFTTLAVRLCNIKL